MPRIRLIILGLLCSLPLGCAAAAVIPGMVGIGAGGYLWGKDALRTKPVSGRCAPQHAEVERLCQEKAEAACEEALRQYHRCVDANVDVKEAQDAHTRSSAPLDRHQAQR